jgi:Tol biopolymer transport system component
VAEDLSADGAWAVFSSAATHLIQGLEHTHPGATDVYLWSRRTGRTTLLSHTAGSPDTTATGPSSSSRISADGRWIAYLSTASDLEAATRDTNNAPDVILESRAGDRKIVTLHARGLASATPTGPSAATSIDASGRFVVFLSAAPELLPDPETPPGASGVFLYDRTARARTLLSGDRQCEDARISADDRFVAFACRGSVFLWSRETGATTLLADREDSIAFDLALSADGSVVAFVSVSPVLVTIFVWDRATGTVSPVAGDRQALGLSLDASGRVVAFHSPATDLVTGVADANGQPDVFVLDRAAGTTTLVSRAADSAEAVGGIFPRVSADGRFVAFTSESTRLVAGQTDFPGSTDLFLYDRQTGTTRLVSHTPEGPAFAAGGVLLQQADLDASGRFVAFASTARDLVFQQADSNDAPDVFLFDREGGPTELVSRTQSAASFTANGRSGEPRLSADGRSLVFLSTATDLTGESGAPGSMNLFLYDRSANTLVSRSFTSPLRRSNGPASNPVLAASGSAVAFTSFASDLVPRDFNQQTDAFVAGLP